MRHRTVWLLAQEGLGLQPSPSYDNATDDTQDGVGRQVKERRNNGGVAGCAGGVACSNSSEGEEEAVGCADHPNALHIRAARAWKARTLLSSSIRLSARSQSAMLGSLLNPEPGRSAPRRATGDAHQSSSVSLSRQRTRGRSCFTSGGPASQAQGSGRAMVGRGVFKERVFGDD